MEHFQQFYNHIRYGVSHAFVEKSLKPGFDERAYGNSFEPTESTSEALAAHVLAGGAIAPGQFKGATRKNDTFICTALIPLDYDDNISVSDLLAVPFVREYATLVYPTASSSRERYKTRVFFVLDTPVYGVEPTRALIRAIAEHIGLPCDPASYKPAQPFFGSLNTIEAPHINRHTVLPLAWATNLMIEQARADYERATAPKPERKAVALNSNRAERYATAAYDHALQTIASAPDGSKNDTLFRGALNLFSMVGWPGITASRIEADLEAIYSRWPNAHKSKGTVTSAKRTASPRPLELPERSVKRSKGQGKTTEERPWPPKLPPVKLNAFTPDCTVQARYVSNIDLSARTIALKSPLNTGKTTAQIEHIKRYKPRRVLFLTYLQSLVGNIVERLNDSDIESKFESYLDIPPDFNLGAIDYLVCSLNSIHRLADAEAYDMVVIDEAEQTLRALWDGTLNGEEALVTLATLKATVGRAEQVIALDAHMSDESASFLASIRGNCTKIENAYRHQWGDLVINRGEAALIAAAEACADKDTGCVVITTGSRAAARKFRQYFEKKYGEDNVRLIYGWNSAAQDVRAFLRYINETLPTLRVFICSPTVGTGVDVQAEVAGVFGHFTGGHLAATEILQQIARYRNAAQRGIFIDHKHRSGLIVDPDQLLERERAKVRRTASLAEFEKHQTVNVSSLQGEITKLWAAFTAASNRQKINVLAYFVALAQQEGFTLRWSAADAPEMKARLKANSEALRTEDDQKTLSLEPVSKDDLDRRRMNGDLVEDDFLAHLRWKIEDTTGQSITDELLATYKSSQNRAALRRFTDYLSSIQVVRQKDRENVKALPFKRGHHVANRLLFENAIRAVFGDEGLANAEMIEAAELERRAGSFIEANAQEIQQLDERTDLSMKTIPAYRRLLKRFGVRLVSKETSIEGQKTMVYWLDQAQLQVIMEHAQRRMAHLETLSKNAVRISDSRVFRQHLPVTSSGPANRPLSPSKLDLDALRKAGPVNPFSKKGVQYAGV